jgi:hypothetical protein
VSCDFRAIILACVDYAGPATRIVLIVSLLEQRRHEHLRDGHRVAGHRLSGARSGEEYRRQGDDGAQDEREPDVRVDRVLLALPGVGRDRDTGG